MTNFNDLYDTFHDAKDTYDLAKNDWNGALRLTGMAGAGSQIMDIVGLIFPTSANPFS